ncbi:MAG TPA: pyridoxal phosphate-dependent aminotransferase, partial [Rhodothermales bacterium]|nr:pyridoxal phosphate-dependent aminotransferase [Rhodothermales bacterium]
MTHDADPKPLANRTKSLRQSDIRAVTLLLSEFDAINLGQGVCDMPTPEPIKHGARLAIEDDHSTYTSYAGIAPLRRAILNKARSFNHIPAASEDEILVSVGSTGAFVTAIFTLLEPGDEVVLFEPFYSYHRNLIALTGATLQYVPTRGPGWEIDFEELRRAISPRTKAIVLNTPSNPSGKVWSRAELEAVLSLLQEHDLYAITDEIYEYMTYDGHEHVSLASL